MSLIEFDRQVKDEGFKLLAGVDEAGRGPLAGPVFACAIIMNEDNIIEDINDSKKISEKKREMLYDVILDNALAVSVAYMDEKQIDEINILNATMLAMDAAIKGLEIKPDIVLIDGNRDKGIDGNTRCVVKGDAKSYNVAAASIIAKVSRDRYIREMDEKYPGYGFAKHKGYGTKEHYEAIERLGICEIHRKTFLKKILGEK